MDSMSASVLRSSRIVALGKSCPNSRNRCHRRVSGESMTGAYRFDEMLQAKLDCEGCLPYTTISEHHQFV